ncbi:hypothetical protein [Bacillus sp. FJAT-45350]|uniref:hypothetical protein n=1 Tax=Bacillus sp. FJAT-45350 TaxID=2011014 RepID=UPI000BB7C543|nr:hypothetical protein [Bacillus sp. FJAT-45350]
MEENKLVYVISELLDEKFRTVTNRLDDIEQNQKILQNQISAISSRVGDNSEITSILNELTMKVIESEKEVKELKSSVR